MPLRFFSFFLNHIFPIVLTFVPLTTFISYKMQRKVLETVNTSSDIKAQVQNENSVVTYSSYGSPEGQV